MDNFSDDRLLRFENCLKHKKAAKRPLLLVVAALPAAALYLLVALQASLLCLPIALALTPAEGNAQLAAL